MKMNNENMLIVFDLSKGAGKAREKYDEAKMLSNCLHLNEIMLKKRIDKLLELA